MKKLLTLFLIQILVSGLVLNAQKLSVQKGSLSAIKGQKVLLTTFDYSNMKVGKFDKEDDYVADKMAAYNKSEAGKGEKWKVSWFADREARYEPKFESLFNEYGAKIGLSTSKTATDAQYEMIVHTVYTESGFNVGVMRKAAYIDAEVTFKNITSGEVVAVISVDNCPGRDAMGYDFDTGVRIEEAYAKLGKAVAAYIAKQK